MESHTFYKVACEHLHPPGSFPPTAKSVRIDHWISFIIVEFVGGEDLSSLLPIAGLPAFVIAMVVGAAVMSSLLWMMSGERWSCGRRESQPGTCLVGKQTPEQLSYLR